MDAGQERGVEVFSSRILLRPAEPDRSRRFDQGTFGLAIYREFGPAEDPGLVFFGGQGFLGSPALHHVGGLERGALGAGP